MTKFYLSFFKNQKEKKTKTNREREIRNKREN